MICPTCHGDGLVRGRIPTQLDKILRQETYVPCSECGGSGIAYCCDSEPAQDEEKKN